ncbi:hypothetical protein GCM10022226_05720 [Sphaerisporangium flaviroseum]|uniref:STAS domain-containing protein n=1 Tax=Sphaerisporangium flaviroseum TaxID=509199 RepID=A0ABP7HCV6_9ACTN
MLQRRRASAIVDISGDLDAGASGVVDRFLLSLVDQGCTHILIEGRRLLFCDVAGARVLNNVHERMRPAGGGLVVIVQPALWRFFGLIWPGGLSEYPVIMLAERPERDITPRPARHVAVIRSLNHERPLPRRKPGGIPRAVPEMPHPVLERSRVLREQAQSHLKIMHERVGVAYATMAEIQERLVVARATLRVRQDARRALL